MKIESQFVNCIDVGDRLRAVDENKVKQIAESMKGIGLLNPIHVAYYDDASTCLLVAGAHRLAAAKLLGWESIDTIEISGGGLAEQLAEIDENLCRSELTATQEAEHLARRKVVWEAMEGAARVEAAQAQRDLVGGESGRTPATLPTTGRGNTQFAAATSAVTGKAKSTINQAIRRATEVCQEARDLIRGTKLDTGSYLDSIAKQDMTDAEQVAHVREALEQLADRERRKQLADEAKAREEAAKQERRDARNEACHFLHNKLTATEWGYLIDMLERGGGSLRADDLRNWESPLAKVA